jgi:aminomethyltransferase
MALYGNDIDEEHTVLEADLEWIAKWRRAISWAEALARQKKGVARKLVGFEMVDRGIARHGYPQLPGSPDTVTSGSFALT